MNRTTIISVPEKCAVILTLAFAAFSFYLKLPYLFDTLYTSSWIFGAAACAIMAVIFVFTKHSGGSVRFNPYMLIPMVFVIVLFMSGFGVKNINRELFFTRIWQWAIILLFVFLSGVNGFSKNKDKFFAGLTVSGFILSLYGIMQLASFYLKFSLPGSDGNNFGFRVFSLLGNPDVLAAFLVFSIPAAWYFFSRKASRVTAALFLTQLAVMLLTRSFSGIMAVVFEAVVIYVFVSAKKANKFAFPAAVIVAVLLLVFLGQGKSESYQNRKLLWASAIGMSASNPWTGVGAGNYLILSPGYQAMEIKKGGYPDFVKVHDEAYAHNDYLQVLAETGWAGLLLFIAAVFYPFYSFFRSPKKTAGTITAAAAAAGMAVFAAFNFPFEIPFIAALYFLCALIMTSDAERDFNQDWPLRAAAGVVLAAVSVSILMFTGGYFARNYLIKYYSYAASKPLKPDMESNRAIVKRDYQLCFYEGIIKNRSGDSSGAVAAFSRAIELYPYFGGAAYNLGNAYLNSGDKGSAARCYESVISIFRDYGPAYNNLGIIYTEKGDLDGAIRVLTEGVKWQPASMETRYSLSKALFLKGAFREALGECNKALYLKGNYGPALELKARILKVIPK